jgi:DNA mismatch repair protein MutS
MNAEYQKLSRHYVQQYGPKTAVLLQVGSFYELYDAKPEVGERRVPEMIHATAPKHIHNSDEGQTPMRRAVEILGIQIVEKKSGEISAGFPDYAVHKHASMLTREGWTVVLVNQIKKGGKVSGRGVVRILSPGTHLETAAAEAVYLAGLWMEEDGEIKFAASVFDFTTGAVKIYETVAAGCDDTWSADDLVHFFQVHPPREIAVWYRGAPITQPSEDHLRRALGLFNTSFHIRAANRAEQGALEKDFVREEILREFFKSRSVLPTRVNLQIDSAPAAERCLVNLCRFIQDHYPSATDVAKIHRMYYPERWVPKNSVFLGNHALTQLNMITPNGDGIVDMFTRTHTGFGRRAMRERILYPICCPEELEERYERVASFDEFTKEQRQRIDAILKSLCDVPRTHRRLVTGSVSVADILALDHTYIRSAELMSFVPSSLVEQLRAYHELFTSQFDVEKGLMADAYTFCMRKEVAPKTWEAEQECRGIIERAQKISDFLCEWIGIPKESLKVDSEGGLEIRLQGARLKQIITTKIKDSPPPAAAWKNYQITVKKVAADYDIADTTMPHPFKSLHVNVRKSMASSIECNEIDILRSQLAAAAAVFARAVEEELPVVCDTILSGAGGLVRELEEWLAGVDVTYTINRISKELGFCRPRLDEAAAFAFVKINHLRHPLIEKAQASVEYVTHDIAMTNEKGGHLIYGVNASGKSSLMKSCGIAILLAQAGCYVPATEFVFWPFRRIFTRIQSSDNIWAGLSSFAVEMTELREILQTADANTLVLGDEVCSGTESTSATALVGATLEHLHDVGAKFLFATHLHGLLSLPRVPTMPGISIWHLLVRYDPVTQKLIYDRTLKEGAGNSLYGLEVARAMGLPRSVLERAIELRHIFVGTARTENALATGWNSQLARHKCGVCNHAILRDLEVHHIRQQVEAGDDGRFDNGLHKNHLSNLIVVCQECHDAHHAGKITIGPARMTSDGMEREVIVQKTTELAKTSTTEEVSPKTQTDKVIEYIKKYPRATPSRLQHELEVREGIKLSIQKLGAMRKNVKG